MARNLMLGDAVLYQQADGLHAVGQGRVSDYWYAPWPALSPEEEARLINEQIKACKRDQQTNVADLSERQEVKPSDVLRAQSVIDGRMVVSDPAMRPGVSLQRGGVLPLHPIDYAALMAARAAEKAERDALPWAMPREGLAHVLRNALKGSGKKVEPIKNKLIDACSHCGRTGNDQHDSDNRCSSCSPWPAKYDWKSMPASMPISREVYVKDEATRLAEAQDLEQAMQEAGWVGRTLEPRIAAALTMEPQAFSRRVWSLQEE